MTLILLAVSFTIALTMLAWHFAIYALPFMVGLAAFRYVHATDASVLMSMLAALGTAGLSVVVAAAILAFVRAPLLRLPVLAVFAAPAALAGYAVVHGVAHNVIEFDGRAQSSLRLRRPRRRHRRAAEHQRTRRRLLAALKSRDRAAPFSRELTVDW